MPDAVGTPGAQRHSLRNPCARGLRPLHQCAIRHSCHLRVPLTEAGVASGAGVAVARIRHPRWFQGRFRCASSPSSAAAESHGVLDVCSMLCDGGCSMSLAAGALCCILIARSADAFLSLDGRLTMPSRGLPTGMPQCRGHTQRQSHGRGAHPDAAVGPLCLRRSVPAFASEPIQATVEHGEASARLVELIPLPKAGANSSSQGQ